MWKSYGIFKFTLGILLLYVPSEIVAAQNHHHHELHRVQRELSFLRYSNNTKCQIEVPTKLLISHHNQVIHGNGTNSHLSRVYDCCPGYKKYEHDPNICVPDCGDKCKNGFCIAPNNCICFPTFVKSGSGECVNTCPFGCLNGKCSSSGLCVCDDPVNYELNQDRTFCRPKCGEYGCREPYQNCTEPRRCECREGFKLNHQNNCVPSCKADCYGGVCIAPNICRCDSNHILKDGICQYRCVNSVCTNGVCLDNGSCQCFEGYEYDFESTACVPKCYRECKHGVCVAPNKCKCHDGYGKYENKGECLPICDPKCCVKPSICDCGPQIEGVVQYRTLRSLSGPDYCLSP